MLVHKRLDRCITLLLWMQQHWSAILVELISVDLLTCRKIRDVSILSVQPEKLDGMKPGIL